MDDLISRKAAIDAAALSAAEWDGMYVQDINGRIRKALEKLPPAQPERKTGRWILYDKRFPWRQDYKCSECGNYLDFSGVNAGRGQANFCPNCGADMREEKVKCGDEDTLQGGLMSAT